ncbi:MAG: hypothetical protein KJ587_03850 [Alphaproteobacteria bacterium]|nr:hypothetical protein [Alphaproteobacteria bacterium]
MNERVKAILDDARRLTTAERQELFELLEIEFDREAADASAGEIAAAWMREIELRSERADSRSEVFTPAESVLARMQNRLARK